MNANKMLHSPAIFIKRIKIPVSVCKTVINDQKKCQIVFSGHLVQFESVSSFDEYEKHHTLTTSYRTLQYNHVSVGKLVLYIPLVALSK